MNKIIQFFKWDFEGEYQNYFYVVDEDKEAEFVKETEDYLNNVQSEAEFFWADCLKDYKPELQVDLNFCSCIHILHIRPCYYIETEPAETIGEDTRYKFKLIRMKHLS